MSQPLQHPPEPSGNCSTAVIVGHHLLASFDAKGGKGLDTGFRIREGVSSTLSVSDRGGKIPVKVCVESPWDVGFLVIVFAFFRKVQIETAVDDDPARII